MEMCRHGLLLLKSAQNAALGEMNAYINTAADSNLNHHLISK